MSDTPDTAAVLQRYTRAFLEHDPALLEALAANRDGHDRFGPAPADAQRGLNVLIVRDGLIAGGRGYAKAAA